MGRRLTLEEMLMSAPPEAAHSPMLRNMPKAVVACVNRMLNRGLRTLAEERYQTAEEMRLDFAGLKKVLTP